MEKKNAFSTVLTELSVICTSDSMIDLLFIRGKLPFTSSTLYYESGVRKFLLLVCFQCTCSKDSYSEMIRLHPQSLDESAAASLCMACKAH